MAATNSRTSSIKRAQKESQLYRTISELFMKLAQDDPRLADLTINRVSLSNDKSLCRVYFYTAQGEAAFREKLPYLILYKPSLRKALAQSINARYTPQIEFAFDAQFEKQMELEGLLEKIKGE